MNIKLILVTKDVSEKVIDELKLLACWNICVILVTDDVLKLTDWLKLLA